MKNLFLILLILAVAYSCKSTKTPKTKDLSLAQTGDTITISSDKIEYDIIIIEPGFNTWLKSIAKPEGFYTQQYLENKNVFYVTEWNNRTLQPQRFNSNLYELQIDYRSNIDYGYDVNYKLYNYFVYFQNRYKQNLLGGRIPPN